MTLIEETQRACISSLSRLRQLLANSKYQIQLGGHFSSQLYGALLDKADSIFRSISLVVYSSRIFDKLDDNAVNSVWTVELRRVASRNEDARLRMFSVLSICADSIQRGQPLPPHLDVPESSQLLLAIKTSAMDLRHMKHALEPGYSALATIHASALMLTEEVKELVKTTRELVGLCPLRSYARLTHPSSNCSSSCRSCRRRVRVRLLPPLRPRRS